MRQLPTTAARAIGLLLGLTTGPAAAEGELFVFNWTDYTAPALIEAFERETGIEVTLDTYDSNETLLTKLKSGGDGYDIVVPTHYLLPILIDEGLIQEIDATALEGFDNIEGRWRGPPWDPENRYSVPWQWGTTAFTVDTDVYDGDIDSYALLFEPPPELRGRIGMLSTPYDVIPMALIYLGLPLCSEDPGEMDRVLALLRAQKPHVKVYSSEGVLERLLSGDTAMHGNWNGYSLRARKEKPALRYAYPREGIVTWFDSLVVPRGARNPENARRFLAFVLRPENAALQSNFTGYANGIAGSARFMSEALRDAPEIVPPADIKTVFAQTCPQAAIELADRVWTKLLQ